MMYICQLHLICCLRNYLEQVLGADAVSVGTAFLATKESGAKPFYKQAIYDSSETDTAPTRVFTGRLARGDTFRFIPRALV